MKAYLINLDRSPDRLAFFQQQAAAVGLTFDRISAIDGRRLTDQERADATADRFEFQPINAGELALFMSHQQAWQLLIESGHSAAAVFEDDAVLASNLADTLRMIEESQPDFDVIKLESTLRPVVCSRMAHVLPAGQQLQRLHTWHGGTAGYVISARCAARLLRLTEKLADPVDQVMFHPGSRICSQLNILQLNPAGCIQNDILEKHSAHGGTAFGSTIDRHVTRRKLFRHGLWIDLRRLFRKQVERKRRNTLARLPELIQLIVPFASTNFAEGSGGSGLASEPDRNTAPPTSVLAVPESNPQAAAGRRAA